MSQTDTPCVAFLRKLLAAIEERSLGEQATSVGHKGRSMQYAELSLEQMVNFYRQRYAICPDVADTDLPELQALNGPVGRRGRPAQFLGRGHV